MGFIYGGDTGVSYEDLQRKREIAKMLAQQASSGATNVPEGLTRLGQGIMSAILQGQDKKATSAFNDTFNSTMFGKNPVVNALKGGGAAKASVPSAGQPFTGEKAEMVDYIKTAATKRGINPDIAVRVAASEGLNADPKDGWQSNFVKNGKRERSYGPFQLYVDGGLGNEFMKSTGLDPSNPGTWKQQVDFALDAAAKGGWGPWYGAKRIGLDNWAGIERGGGGGGMQAVAQALAPNVQPASAPPPGMMENGQPAPMGTAMTGFPPQPPPMVPSQAGQPPAAPQIVPAGGPPPMAPQAPMTAYQRMMAQGIDKGEAGGLQGRVGQQQMASVMGQGGGVSPGILSALGLGGGGGAPQAPMAAAPNPNDPAVQQSMGKVAADTNAMSQEQIGQGAEQELAQVPTEQLISLFNDPRANPQQRAFLQSMIEKRMQEQDPTYQMGLEKQRLELEALKNPKPDKPETKEVGGRVVEKQPDGSWKEVYAAPEKPAEPKTQVIELPDGRKIPVDMNNPPAWVTQYQQTGQLPPEMAGANGGKPPPKPDDVLKFRKDFNNQPGVSRINEIAPTLQSMYRSIGDPSAMSDLNFVYGLAKILDPTSVVRESESGMVIAAQGIVPQMLGELNKFASGEQAMSTEARMNLFNVALSRAQELQKQAQGERGQYEGMMQDQGIDTGKYLPEVPSIPSWKPKQDQPQPPAGMVPQKAGAAPAVPTVPQQPKEGERKYPFNPKDPASWVKGDVVLGKRFLGGDRRDPKNWVKVE